MFERLFLAAYAATVLVLLILSLLMWAVQPAEAADLLLLRDVICGYETRHLDDPDGPDAVSHDSAVGRCQILPSTAHFLGYDWRRLDDPGYGYRVALAVLRHCQGVGKRAVVALARCYGPTPGHVYGKIIAVEYAQESRRRQWNPRYLLAVGGP